MNEDLIYKKILSLIKKRGLFRIVVLLDETFFVLRPRLLSYFKKNKGMIITKKGIITKEKNYFFRKPGSLSEISIALTEMNSEMNYKWVLIESLEDLLIFNEPYAVRSFVEYLRNHFRLHNIKGIASLRYNETSSMIIPKIIDLSNSSFFEKN